MAALTTPLDVARRAQIRDAPSLLDFAGGMSKTVGGLERAANNSGAATTHAETFARRGTEKRRPLRRAVGGGAAGGVERALRGVGTEGRARGPDVRDRPRRVRDGEERAGVRRDGNRKSGRKIVETSLPVGSLLRR